MSHFLWLAGAAAIAVPVAVAAQPAADTKAAPPEADAPPVAAPPGRTRDAEAAVPAGAEIVVTGFRRNREDVLAGTSVVSGAELTRELRPTIGETL
ncbi:MAG: iron complex outerrane recepter protein, partial [Sphingomonadales bacterium]|nr:iron complex outerrane recepter protein [Sphingomonadales bacterium]